ncbi:MAG TPA: hypothetical protein ENK07_05225 [Bacteroidetes bacterium]|nr:hypothetical protein [Bacteroidota bacterium]
MLEEIRQNIRTLQPRSAVRPQTQSVLRLDSNEDSLDLNVLQDLLAATPSLRVYVETYDPETGYYRLAILGKLDS